MSMPTRALPPTGNPKCFARSGVIGPVIVKPSRFRKAAAMTATTEPGTPPAHAGPPPAATARSFGDWRAGATRFTRGAAAARGASGLRCEGVPGRAQAVATAVHKRRRRRRIVPCCAA